MRVPPQEALIRTAEAFGANAQEIPAVEIYQALQTGVVDGQDNPPSNIWDYKIYEVSKYLTITNYATGPDPFFVSLAWYESLPQDLQEVFDAVAQEKLQRLARGNSLFRNNGKRTGKEFGFSDVSVETATTMGRWAWGSSFVDINNDAYQDLIVANGFITTDDTSDL